MTLHWLARPVWFTLIAASILGCSKSIPTKSIASVQSALDEAKQKVQSGDSAGALPLIEEAINGVGLDPDQYVEAVLIRARCYAETGDLEKAEADLQEAELGDPNEALMHFTRAIVLDKQGQASQAKKEFAAAKRLDPSLVAP